MTAALKVGLMVDLLDNQPAVTTDNLSVDLLVVQLVYMMVDYLVASLDDW